MFIFVSYNINKVHGTNLCSNKCRNIKRIFHKIIQLYVYRSIGYLKKSTGFSYTLSLPAVFVCFAVDKDETKVSEYYYYISSTTTAPAAESLLLRMKQNYNSRNHKITAVW